MVSERNLQEWSYKETVGKIIELYKQKAMGKILKVIVKKESRLVLKS